MSRILLVTLLQHVGIDHRLPVELPLYFFEMFESGLEDFFVNLLTECFELVTCSFPPRASHRLCGHSLRVCVDFVFGVVENLRPCTDDLPKDSILPPLRCDLPFGHIRLFT